MGVDSRKDVLAACLVDASGVVIDQRSIANTEAGHAELVSWARAVDAQRVGIEGAGNYRRPAAEALINAGAAVVEAPAQMTASACRKRRTYTNNDPVDALEIARIAARDDDLPAPRFAGAPGELACLVAYRRELVKDRTAAINRLHSSFEKIRWPIPQPHRGAHQPRRTRRCIKAVTRRHQRTRRDRTQPHRQHTPPRPRGHAVTKRLAAALKDTHTSLDSIHGVGR